jgi:hypothetical protein
MRKALLLVFVVIGMSNISGCMVELVHDPETSHLCSVAELNGWERDSDSSTHVRKKIGDFTYSFSVFDLGSGNKARWAIPFGHPNGDNQIVGPIADVHWIELNGVGDAPPGNYGPINQRSLIYDPSEAVLTIGQTTYRALPRVWRGSTAPTTEASIPIDLDARKQKDYGTNFVFLAFPTKPPLPGNEYTFSPGSIVLDGVRTALPVFKSCHRDGKTYWRGIR